MFPGVQEGLRVCTFGTESLGLFSLSKRCLSNLREKQNSKIPTKASYVLCFSADLIKEQFTLACSLNVYKRECFMGIQVLHSPSHL